MKKVQLGLGLLPTLSLTSLTMPAMGQAPAIPATPTSRKATPLTGAGGTVVATQGKLGKAVASADLQLDTQALTIEQLKKNGMSYMPTRIALSADKPAGIKNEPTYVGKPRYGSISIGNGPNKNTLLVVDDKEGGGGKLYVDLNRNGDLTDDNDSAWAEENKRDGVVWYGVTQRVLRGSWADPKDTTKETSTGPYSLGFYYREGGDSAYVYRQTARVGTLELNGKKVPVQLIENDSDGIYDRALAPAPEKLPDGTSGRARPVWLNINSGSGGPVAAGVGRQMIAVNGPFRIDGKVYEVRVTPDGSRLTLYPSDAVIPEPPKLPPAPGLLAVGKDAPDFTVDAYGGGQKSLADFKGRVVVLDFWATWCGPCQASMPHLEGVYQSLKGREDVAILAVCVSDERTAYEKWATANIGKNYNFPIFFDPAARDSTKSISRNKFGVSGIPTKFIIGKDGKIAAALVGYGGENDHRLEEELKKLGVDVAATAAPGTTVSTAK